MRYATTKLAICIVLGPMSQATCPARTLWWITRRSTTELLTAWGWVTTLPPPCSGCTHSNCAKWYALAILPTSTTFFLCPEDIPHRIDLSADDIFTMHKADGDKVERMPVRKSTRFRVTASGEPILVPPTSDAPDVDSRGSQMRGSRILGRMPEQTNRHVSRNTRRSWAQRITSASNMAKTRLLMQSSNI